MPCCTFELNPVSPFRLDLTVWTLRRRADNVVDRWDGKTYRRILALSDGLVEVAVTQILARWDGYGGLLYFHLLLERLAEAGSLGHASSKQTNAG